MKKIFATILFSLGLCTNAFAYHGSYNPMAPRQITVKSYKADYSYGLTVLPGNTIDSIEGINRHIGWNVNYYVLDKMFLRPLAHGYAHLPSPVKSGVHNFFSNVSDLNNTVNNFLLGEFSDSSTSISRFFINSTIGLLGLIDVADYMGIEKKPMKMSTVMGRYGVDQGAYVVAIGPSTQRDIHGNLIDNWPYAIVGNPFITSICFVIDGIDTRSRLIEQEKLIDESIDPYAQTRQIYLMYQEGLVNPNAAMENKEDKNVDEFLDEIDE